MGLRIYPRQIVNLNPGSVLRAFSAALTSALHTGEESQRFSHLFSKRIGSSDTLLVSSARFGLALALEELGLKPGDEVLLTTYTFHAMPNMIAAMGMRPVFVDIRETDFNMDSGCVGNAITPRTKAVLATHIYGQPAEMKALREIADDRGLFLLEDCAEATGAEYRGKPVGCMGDVGLFSFSMGKPLVGLGGGAITTSDRALAEGIRTKIEGFSSPSPVTLLKSALSYAHMWLSSNPRTFWCTTYPLLRLSAIADSDVVDRVLSGTRKKEERMHGTPRSEMERFSGLHARILLHELESLDAMNRRRIEIAETYDRIFRGSEKIGTAELSPRNKNIYNAYGVRVPGRSHRDLQRHLLRRGVDTKKRHMYVCSELEMFKEFRRDCPVARRTSDELIHLPINHYMGTDDACFVAKNVIEAVRSSLSSSSS